MRRALAFLVLIVGLVAAGPAFGATQAGITSPADGSHSLSGVVPVTVTASADAGIYSVQLNVDGVAYGAPDLTTTSLYQYEIDWNTAGFTTGSHTLTVTATDWSAPLGGVSQVSAPVTVDVGPAYPTIALTSPQAWTFVKGSVSLSETHTSDLGPGVVAFTVDGSATPSSWNTTTVADGSHTIVATVTDGRGKQATDTETVTVDNTPPTTYVEAPPANASFTGSLPVTAHASDAYGIGTVQFSIDGVPTSVAVNHVLSSYDYTAVLPLTGLANGTHQLTSIATDSAGNVAVSAKVPFAIGTPPLAAALTAPPDCGYARKTASLTTSVTGGTGPYSVQPLLDGVAVGAPVTVSPYSFVVNTSALADGTHTFAVTVTDAKGVKVTSASLHETVDNTPPVAVLYQPTANASLTGTTTLQVHASDAYGVKSVQFSIDGKLVGSLLTSPDLGQLYLFTTTYDTSALADGTHTVVATVTDNAGNTTSSAPVSFKTGALAYLPVLNFHGIENLGASPYDLTSTQADDELAYLKAQGYHSVTLEQYAQWKQGANIGVTKPILLTVDDAVTIDQPWDALLQKYGFTAVLFVITGFADAKTPGDTLNNMTWPQIQAFAANGRWQIAFHAGTYGHGTEYGNGVKIGDQSYEASCPYFYSCLSGTSVKKGTTTTWVPETVAQLKTAVTNEVTAGMAELKAKVPTADFSAWAAPFNDAGQWTNLYNDPSNQVQAWFPGFFAGKFPIVFTQTDPVVYGQASGTVGSLSGYDRQYRFEVDGSTTIAEFTTALTDPGFSR